MKVIWPTNEKSRNVLYSGKIRAVENSLRKQCCDIGKGAAVNATRSKFDEIATMLRSDIALMIFETVLGIK